MNLNVWATTAYFLFFFLLGFLSTTSTDLDSGDVSATSTATTITTTLQRQKQPHLKFQAQIHALQRGCPTGRTLTVLPSGISPVGANDREEFARAFQYLALSLQVAVATERTLTLDPQWTLLPPEKILPQCTSWTVPLPDQSTATLHSIFCLRQALHSNACTSTNDIRLPTNPASYGIIREIPIGPHNSLFHADFYGTTQSSIEMPSWPYPKDTYLIDVVPHWERQFGRFWIRSQMVHYLWHPTWHQPQPTPFTTTTTTTTTTPPAPYIAFYWSSCPKLRSSLATKFGRDPKITQSMERYMSVALTIQKLYHPSFHTIVLVTDGPPEPGGGSIPLPDFAVHYPDWTFVEFKITRDDNQERAMLAQLEVLRRALYLVGSFQSQFYRLAAQLNAAYYLEGQHYYYYPRSHRRHWTVDVEWFENP